LHFEKALLKTVNKGGPNKGKQFYSCPRPAGQASDSSSKCAFFQWKT